MKELVMIDGNSLLYRAYYATAAMGNLMVIKMVFLLMQCMDLPIC